jgi:hypothetical protein
MAVELLLLGLASTAFFVLVGLEEYPWAFNVKRASRALRRHMRRRNLVPHEALRSLRRNTRIGAHVLLWAAVVSGLVVLVPTLLRGRGWNEPVLAVGGPLVLGLGFLGYAFLRWAPRLLDRVEADTLSATTNSLTPDVPRSHGPSP